MPGADGQIRIKVGSDTSGLDKDIEKLTAKLNKQSEAVQRQALLVEKLQQKYDALISGEKKTSKELSLTRQLKDAGREMEKLDGQVMAGHEKLEAMQKITSPGQEIDTKAVQDQLAHLEVLERKSEEAAEKWMQLKKELKEIQMNPAATGEAQRLKKELELAASKGNRLSEEMHGTERAVKAAANSSGKNAKQAKKVEQAVSTTASKVKRQTKEIQRSQNGFKKLGDTAKKAANKATSGFSSLLKRIKNLALAATVFNVVRRALSSMSEYLGKALKTNSAFTSSLASIKGNLLTAFQPVFEAVLPAINALMNGLARITGYIASFINALFGKTVSSSQKAAESLYSQADGYRAVGAAAKDANGQLAGFDKLDVLQQDNSSSVGGGASAGTAPSFDMDSSDVGLIGDISKALEPTINALKRLWGRLKPLKDFTANALIDFYEKFLRPVGSWVIGEGIPRLCDGLGNLVERINWDKLNQSLERFWAALTPLTISLMDGLVEFCEKVLGPLAEWTISEALPAFLEALSYALYALDSAWQAVKPAWDYMYENFLRPLAEWTGGAIVTIIGYIGDAFRNLGDIFNEKGDKIQKIISAISDVFSALWTVAEPIFDGFIKAIGTVFDFLVNFVGDVIDWFSGLVDFFKGVFSGDLSLAWDGIKQMFSAAWNSIKNVFSSVGQFFKNVFSGAWENIKKVWSSVSNWFKTKIADPIVNTFRNLKESVSNFFSGLWNNIKNVFSSVADWFRRNVTEPIGNFFKGAINTVIKGLNWMIRALNKISIPIPNWGIFGDMAGKRFGVNIKEIPYLAAGAVIPPNSPFMAVLGDQSRGVNIETPLDTMIDAFKAALSQGGYRQKGDIVLQIDGKTFARVIAPYEQAESFRVGGKLVIKA